MDQKSPHQRYADAIQSGPAQHFGAIGDQIAGDSHFGGQVFAVDEMPFVTDWIEHMADAIMLRQFGQLPRSSVDFEIGRRTAQYMPPGREAADDEA